MGKTRELVTGVAQVDDDLAPGTMVGEYRVLAKIGEGGMGVVYSAVHPVIGKKAAVKVLSGEIGPAGEAIERFVLEARSVNQIGDPNIVDIFAFGELDDGRAYYVMEWLDGENLGERLARKRPSAAQSLQILDSVAKTLQNAHEKGIVHRDLKPENIFLVKRRDGIAVKLLDFGIAKLVGQEDNRLNRTQTGTVLGTPLYLSPEQARGAELDERTDIYSLGTVAYELLSGAPPFPDGTPVEVMFNHIHKQPPALSQRWREAPAMLDALLVAMVAKAPEARPSLSQIRAVLQSALDSRSPAPGAFAPGRPKTATPDMATYVALPHPPGRPRPRWPLLAGGAVVIAAAAIAAFLLLGGGEDGRAVVPDDSRGAIAPIAIPADAAPAPTVEAAVLSGDELAMEPPDAGVPDAPGTAERDRKRPRRRRHEANPEPWKPGPVREQTTWTPGAVGVD